MMNISKRFEEFIFVSCDILMILVIVCLKVITILCGPQANLGAVRSTAIPLLKEVLEPLARELVNSLQPDPNASFPVATGFYR